MDDHPDDPPEGFLPLAETCEAELHSGPYYTRRDGDEALIGFRVRRRHLNRSGICHGGVLATLADMNVTPILRDMDVSRMNPTISMSLDYMAPARLGQWVQAESRILKTTRHILFSECLITADGDPAVRASVVYKLGKRA